MIDLERITHPLRLARGSHKEGSGKGCAMNVISYVNGDAKITDYPECSARPLSRLVQKVNDALADIYGFLSPENAVIALDLGWRTVGTADVPKAVVHAWVAELLDSPEWGVTRQTHLDPKATEVIHAAADLHRKAVEHPETVLSCEWRTLQFQLNLEDLVADTSSFQAVRNAMEFAANSLVLAAACAADSRVPPSSFVSPLFITWTLKNVKEVALTPITKAPFSRALALIEYTTLAIDAWRRLAGLDEQEIDYTATDAALVTMASK